MIEKLKRLLAAFEVMEYLDSEWRASISDLRTVIAQLESSEPVAYVVALPGRPISMTCPVNQLDKLSVMHNAPLFAAPVQPKDDSNLRKVAQQALEEMDKGGMGKNIHTYIEAMHALRKELGQ